MHGMIFAELKKYVYRSLGEAAWHRVSERAGVTRMSNLATESYPDEELFALIDAAAELANVPREQLLLEFGAFMVPDLMKVFGAFVDRHWKAMDMLEHTESVIHRAVRLQDAKAEPPKLRITRDAEDGVTIVYTSARRLCSVGIGIVDGIAVHYGEPLTVVQTTCMLKGAPQCTLVVRHAAPAAPGAD
jgi:predicted hydrocarbon binding protein